MFKYRQVNNRTVAGIFLIVSASATTLMGCSAEDTTIFKGQLQLAEKGRLPDNATARITLVEQHNKTGHIHIVAEHALHGIEHAPIDFKFNINSQRLEGDKQYGLSAEITDKENKTLWKTLLPKSIRANESGRSIKLLLEPKNKSSGHYFQHYRCDGDFEFDLFSNNDEAIIHIGKRQMCLQADTSLHKKIQTFTDYPGNKLRLGKDQAVFYIDGDEHKNCLPKDNDSNPDK